LLPIIYSYTHTHGQFSHIDTHGQFSYSIDNIITGEPQPGG
jgi:VCBS repeat-containing protein